MTVALHVLGFFGVPLVVVLLGRRVRLPSPVITCYVIGIVAGNLGLPVDRELTIQLAGVAVLLAIPLLLFSADLLGTLRLARTTLLSSGLCFVCVALSALLTAPLFAPRVGPEGWKVAGMLAGTYTGSMPNLISVAAALEVEAETQVQVIAADLVVAGLYGLFLLSPAVRVFGWLLPAYRSPGGPPSPTSAAEPSESRAVPLDPPPVPPHDWGLSLGLALLIATLAAALALILPRAWAHLESVVAILAVTTLAVLASLLPALRALRAGPLLGDFMLVVFCCAFGCLADLSELLESGGLLFAWTCSVLVLGIVGHALLCRLARIDRDTCVITHTAAIYTPAFVPPVAANLKNRELVLAGISAALIGIAAGNYLGLAVAYGARWLIGG